MIFMTSRWESLRDVTVAWLKRYLNWEDARGFMRPMEHTSWSSHEVKRIFLQGLPKGCIVYDDDINVRILAEEYGHQGVNPCDL